MSKPMQVSPTRVIGRVLVPEGILLSLLLLAPRVPAFVAVRPYVSLLAAAVFASALTIGWRFGRGRLIQAVAVLGAAAVVTKLPAGTARDLGAVLVPLDLALIALLPDRGLVSRSGVARGLVAAVQVGLVVLLHLRLEVPGIPWPAWTAPGPAGWLDPVLALYLPALVVLVGVAVARGDAPSRGLLWAGVAALATQLDLPGGTTWHVTAGALILLVAALEEAHELAYRDPLTGLPSRRALDERLQRIGGRYAVAMIDVDHFKAFNDRHGHDVGDQVLRMVAGRLREMPRARAFRYGGEEFTLVFRGQSVADVRKRLDELRKRIAESEFVIRAPDRTHRKPRRRGRSGNGRTASTGRGEKTALSVTVSVGVAERSDRARTAVDVLADADDALYRAKRRGRNRVVA